MVKTYRGFISGLCILSPFAGTLAASTLIFVTLFLNARTHYMRFLI